MSVGVVAAGQGAGQSERGWWRVASKTVATPPLLAVLFRRHALNDPGNC
jgi:hypothetical protein